MAVVNLSEKYASEIQKRFAIGSLLQGRLAGKVDFLGARIARIYSVNPMPLNDYNRNAGANRYGVPEEIGDSLQELEMTQDKSFTGTIDKGNTLDQSINKAGYAMKVEMDEVVIPTKDRYGFGVLASKAGNIVGSGTAISASNVIARVSAARAWMLNHRVPLKGRTWFVTTDIFNALLETDHFKNLEKLGGKALVTGQVGELVGAPVVEVPADLMPKGVNFIYLHKSAGASPSKIADTKLHTDPPGISGNLLEGRFYWDTFVFGAKANGIYVDVTTGSGTGANVLATPTVNATTGAITGVTAGATAKYTLDGTDPRYSTTAQVGTATGAAVGQTVRAYQYNGAKGVYPSGVVSVMIEEAPGG